MGACISFEGRSVSSSAVGKPWAFVRRSASTSSSMSLRAEKRKTQEEEELARIPGRVCTNGSNNLACLFTQQGRKGTNQDAMLVWENFTPSKGIVFCGVFDGHGPLGHLVARRVRDSLPSKLCLQWEATMFSRQNNNEDGERGEDCNVIGNSQEEGGGIDEQWKLEKDMDQEGREFVSVWKETFLKAFKVMDKELRLHPSIDCFCSGSTAVTLVKQGNHLIMGNVGDSRAVMATRENDNTLTATQLTVDLKPNLPREEERIKQLKGRVFALPDEPDVARVWLPNEDSPGLAMARAFGDFCLKDYGLIAVPDVSYRKLNARDEFIVLATDGVWDVLSNQEVVDIVATAPTKATSARSLVEHAVRSWRFKYPTSKVDDCAVVCLFLSEGSNNQHMVSEAKVTVKEEINTESEQIPLENEDEDGNVSPTLGRLNTVRDTPMAITMEITEEEEDKRVIKSSTSSRRSLAECLTEDQQHDDEWSALEGITRVNSLLNLPRYLLTRDRSSRRWRKPRHSLNQ